MGEGGSPSALSARTAFGPSHSASALCTSKQKLRFHDALQPGAGTYVAHLDDGHSEHHDDDGGFGKPVDHTSDDGTTPPLSQVTLTVHEEGTGGRGGEP